MKPGPAAPAAGLFACAASRQQKQHERQQHMAMGTTSARMKYHFEPSYRPGSQSSGVVWKNHTCNAEMGGRGAAAR